MRKLILGLAMAATLTALGGVARAQEDKVVQEARNYYPRVRAASEGMELSIQNGLSASAR